MITIFVPARGEAYFFRTPLLSRVARAQEVRRRLALDELATEAPQLNDLIDRLRLAPTVSAAAARAIVDARLAEIS